MALAFSVGSAILSASLQGHSASTTLTVTAATLVSIAITPPTPRIALGTTQQFTATGTYTDNSTQNLTASVTWASATPSVATISNAAGSNGLATPRRGRHQPHHGRIRRRHFRTGHLDRVACYVGVDRDHTDEPASIALGLDASSSRLPAPTATTRP